MDHGKVIEDWIDGWNTRNLELFMVYYAENAIFASPAVVVGRPGSDGRVMGKSAIRELFQRGLDTFPQLRFEVEDVVYRSYGVILIIRKHNVFTKQPGLTTEIFGISEGLIRSEIAYWGPEEVASRFVVAAKF